MSENSGSTGKTHVSTPNPLLEGNEYADGDYGDAGTVGHEPTAAEQGGSSGGGDEGAGAPDEAAADGGLIGQTGSGADTVPGRADDDTEGRLRRD
jgi:hypothetical protein